MKQIKKIVILAGILLLSSTLPISIWMQKDSSSDKEENTTLYSSYEKTSMSCFFIKELTEDKNEIILLSRNSSLSDNYFIKVNGFNFSGFIYIQRVIFALKTDLPPPNVA